MLIELTYSQKMALTDIVAHYLLLPGRTDLFINCSESPAVETKVEDLLVLLLNQNYDPDQAVFTAGFKAGFGISREGFNSEIGYVHHAEEALDSDDLDEALDQAAGNAWRRFKGTNGQPKGSK